MYGDLFVWVIKFDYVCLLNSVVVCLCFHYGLLAGFCGRLFGLGFSFIGYFGVCVDWICWFVDFDDGWLVS